MARPLGSQLIGREVVLAAIRSALQDVVTGTGGCLIVEGPGGIGKSSILRVAADHPGILAASGAATEVDQWSPLTTVLSTLSHIDGLDTGEVARDRAAASVQVAQLLTLLERRSLRQPLVIIVDDLHWIDEASAWALRSLIPALSSFPVLWMLGGRPMSEHRSASDLVTWLLPRYAQLIQLGPLTDGEVEKLCAVLLGASPSDDLLTQMLRSGGNPFLIQELITTLVRDGVVFVREGRACLGTTKLPTDFLQTVERRLSDLTVQARRLLEAGAIFRRPFSIHEAAALIGESPLELIPATTEVLESGALVDAAGELSFRHDLIREVVYGALPNPVRLALHREAVTVLQGEGRTSLEVVEHLLRSGRVSDSRGEALLRDAVHLLAATAPGTGADLVVRWLQLLDERGSRHTALTALAVRLLAAAGRIDEATSLGKEALRLGIDAVTEAELRLGLCQALKHAGQDKAVVEHARSALTRSAVPAALRAQLHAVQAHGLLSSEDAAAAEEASVTGAALGLESGHYGAYVFATVAGSCAARIRGDGAMALDLAREAVATADTRGGNALYWHPRLWLARALSACDRFAEADAVLELEERESERMGSPWSQPLWHYYRAELLMATGRIDDAAAEAESGVRVAEQLDALALDVPLLALLGQISLYRDDLVSARGYLTRTEMLVADGVGAAPYTVAWPRALIADACGDAAHFASWVATIDPAASKQLFIQEPRAAARLVRWAQQSGDSAKAELIVAASESLADSNPSVVSFRAAAMHAEGVCLLASYEQERRPVALFNREMCGNLLEVWLRFARLVAACVSREQLAEFLRHEQYQMDNLGIHFGYRYHTSPVICHDTEPAPRWEWGSVPQDCPPGGLLPAVRLPDGGWLSDVYGLGFTLLDLSGEHAGKALAESAAAIGIPMAYLSLDDPAVRETYRKDFILVRPDGHVGWRGDRVPAEWSAVLRRVTGR